VHDNGLAAKKRPMLRILTRPKPPYPPNDSEADTSETLRRLLKKRYAELAPLQMPPHLQSPDAIVPPLTPALVQYPTIKKRGRTETREPRQANSAHPLQQQTVHTDWKPRSSWQWKT
jgi:hypothetical protein